MITPEELIQDLIDFYGYEVDLSYAINYIDMVGQYASVNGFILENVEGLVSFILTNLATKDENH